ncbi:MAG: Uma2 family endonuclease [Acidimicrobiales bacterium]|nr:Uma2 family endonuclease [Acidimicrobiales bacterium]
MATTLTYDPAADPGARWSDDVNAYWVSEDEERAIALPPYLRDVHWPITVDQYLQLPKTPLLAELFDGRLVMHASPSRPHQRAVGNLLVALHAASPPHLEVLGGPFDWTPDQQSLFIPDLLVLPRHGDDDLEMIQTFDAPLLCVEVLSPSSRKRDLHLKMQGYARFGCPTYWVIDPRSAGGPTLLVHHLVAGRYVEVARAHGPGAVYETERPFPISVEPARLLD